MLEDGVDIDIFPDDLYTEVFCQHLVTPIIIDSDIERLIRRAAPLTFGMFATIGGPDDMLSRGGGSGIFIAPFLALCARHVSLDLFRLEGRDERPRRGSFLTQHSVALLQVIDPFDQNSAKALWHVDRSWNSRYSDMTMLQVSAEDEISDKIQYEWPTRFFELQLLPPERGATVTAIGYPQLTANPATGPQLSVDAPFTVGKGTVTKIYQIRGDRGMLNFPCYEVDAQFDHGYSGGPVFHEGRLCGLVAAESIVTTLWPAALMTMDSELGQWSVADMLNRGTLSASDWNVVKDRIAIEEDESGRYAFLHDAGESDSRDT